jgi:hypothetical protein
MKTKFLYSILIGIAVTSIIAGTAYALNAITSPGTNLPGSNTLYALKINPSVNGTIAHIVVQFPSGYSVIGSRVYNVQNIGAGHLSFPNSTSLSYDVTSPTLITAGTQVAILLGNISNPSTAGSGTVTFVTKTSTNSTIESAQITLATTNFLTPDIMDTSGNVGIGTSTSPAQKLEVNGTIQIDGNVTTKSANKEFKITAPSGVPICIGTGC